MKYTNFNISFRPQDYKAIEELVALFVTSNKSMLAREAIHFALEHKLDFKSYLMDKKRKESQDDGASKDSD